MSKQIASEALTEQVQPAIKQINKANGLLRTIDSVPVAQRSKAADEAWTLLGHASSTLMELFDERFEPSKANIQKLKDTPELMNTFSTLAKRLRESDPRDFVARSARDSLSQTLDMSTKLSKAEPINMTNYF